MEMSIYGVMNSNDPRFVYKYIKAFDGVCRFNNHFTKTILSGAFLTGTRTITGMGYIITYKNTVQVTQGHFLNNKPVKTTTFKIVPKLFKLINSFTKPGLSLCSIYYAFIYDYPDKIAKLFIHDNLVIDIDILNIADVENDEMDLIKKKVGDIRKKKK